MKANTPTIGITTPKKLMVCANAGNSDVPVKLLNNATKEKAKPIIMTSKYINLVNPFIQTK